MLVAYGFPADEFNKLFSIVSKIMISNDVKPYQDSDFDSRGVSFKKDEQYPHISIAYNVKALSDDEISKTKEALSKKPAFNPIKWDVFPGGKTNFGYLVLEFSVPEGMKKAQEFLRDEFGVKPSDFVTRAHCSVVRFAREDIENVKNLLPEIEKQTSEHMNPIKPDNVQFWDLVGKSYEIVSITERNLMNDSLEEAKKKKKRWMLAPFYGKGDGRSGATVPPFRAPSASPSPKLGPSLPGPTGVNAPQYGTLPAGPTAPMVSDTDFAAAMGQCNEFFSELSENFHICLICNGSGKVGNSPCKMCSNHWSSQRAGSPEDTCVDGGGLSNIVSFSGFDKPWDF